LWLKVKEAKREGRCTIRNDPFGHGRAPAAKGVDFGGMELDPFWFCLILRWIEMGEQGLWRSGLKGEPPGRPPPIGARAGGAGPQSPGRLGGLVVVVVVVVVGSAVR